MNTDFKKQKDFFITGWFTYTLLKLDLADDKDIHPSMMTKIRIHEIESKIVSEVRRGTSMIIGDIEKEMFWGEGALEREPEKKS